MPIRISYFIFSEILCLIAEISRQFKHYKRKEIKDPSVCLLCDFGIGRNDLINALLSRYITHLA